MVNRRHVGRVPGPVAAVDCGTNSTRLLVADAAGATLERCMRITRLGQGVDATGKLDPDAVARTLAVLRDYRAVMDRYGVGAARMAATSAVRDAVNGAEFLEASADIVGVPAEPSRGRRKGGSPSSVPRPTCPRWPGTTWWWTSAAARPNWWWAAPRGWRPSRWTWAACG